MAQRQTLADFGLKRGTRQTPTTHWFNFLEGKADPVKMARNGQNFFTEPARMGSKGSAINEVRFTHVQNVAEKTFVVMAAFLQDESTKKRYTDMRAWQMIVDAWLTGGGTQPAGTPEGLQYLAFHFVTENESQLAMQRELDSQRRAGTTVRTPASTSVEFTPASANWTANPWLRCAQRVAAALSTSPALQITASRAWAISVDENEIHLIVELTSTSALAAPAAPVVEEKKD